MEPREPLTAAERDLLPPPPDRGRWSRLLGLVGGAAPDVQAGIIGHRHQTRPNYQARTRGHGPQGAGGIGDGP